MEKSKEQINEYIIANFKEKSNAEMCVELGISVKKVSAAASWLHRKNVIDLHESKNGFNSEKYTRIKAINNYKNCVINNVNIHDIHVGYKQGEYKNGNGEIKYKPKK